MSQTEILAQESYNELLNLLDWFSLHGPIPTLIGGWAVFAYNSYLGSVDIDLVGPSMGGRFLDLIERFERTHGYEQRRRSVLGLESIFRKPIIRKGKLGGYVEIDACTYESNAASFHEDPQKKLPYALCGDRKLRRKLILNKERVAYVPAKNLLLLYKIKAQRDRTFDLKTKRAVLGAQKRTWLEGKIVKDGSDLIALLDPEPQRYILEGQFDFNLLKKLVEQYHLHFTLETVGELPTQKKSLREYMNISERKVEKWVKDFLQNL